MPSSIYQLKPHFQAMLRPAVRSLVKFGVTANQVTLFACAVSIALGLWIWLAAPTPTWYALLPLWMLLRMALNAADGMLAREHGQSSVLGAYLNELSDVVSDAALYLPLARVATFDPFWLAMIVLLAATAEMAGVIGASVGATRRYDGPMGKSDRAAAFGALGLMVAVFAEANLNNAAAAMHSNNSAHLTLPSSMAWLAWALPLIATLTAWTIKNRIQSGVREANERNHQTHIH